MGQHAAAQGTVRGLEHSQGALLSLVHDARMNILTLVIVQMSNFSRKQKESECASEPH